MSPLLDLVTAAVAVAPATGWAIHARSLHSRLAQVRHDPVSGLLTRAGWTARAERLLRRNDQATVLMCDLDRFKPVNDRFGHQAGDAVLRAVGARLADWCGAGGGIAARLGGDEFAVITPADVTAPRLAELREALTAPVPWPGGPLMVGVSIGISRTGRRLGSLSNALAAADRGMYEDKRAGRRGLRWPLSRRGVNR